MSFWGRNWGYVHRTDLAPTEDILDEYRKGRQWPAYKERFLKLIEDRRIEDHLYKEDAHLACLLCSEEASDHCHRRLVAEYLKKKWGHLEIVHLA